MAWQFIKESPFKALIAGDQLRADRGDYGDRND